MDELNLGMFKAYDIRTKAQNISDALKERLCNAITCYYKDTLKVDSVVIARDARLYVPEIAQAFQKAGLFPVSDKVGPGFSAHFQK